MNKLKVVKVNDEGLEFDNGVKLYSYHSQDCCENHELYFRDLTLAEFEGLEFDLTNDGFFKRVPGYGIELIPIHGFSVRIAGHGSNNGYYSDSLDLIISDGKGFEKTFGISDCQIVIG